MQAAEQKPFWNFPNAIWLGNETTQVVLCPDAGGRVLEYALHGTNVLGLDPKEKEWTPELKDFVPSAGRFDVGPEQLIPQRDELWRGEWVGEITGERSARMISQPHAQTGVQLVREFELAEQGSRLTCTQTIRNITENRTVERCHWSRTFAVGGGRAYVPVTEPSRFPHNYVQYKSGGWLNMRPRDPQIRERDHMIEILGPLEFPKLGMDSMSGWFAYHAPNDLLFVKRFPTFPDRVYNEVAGLSVSIWYPQDRPVIELEPIGPRERLGPGEEASFTETWFLVERPFPADPDAVDLGELRRLVDRLSEG